MTASQTIYHDCHKALLHKLDPAESIQLANMSTRQRVSSLVTLILLSAVSAALLPVAVAQEKPERGRRAPPVRTPAATAAPTPVPSPVQTVAPTPKPTTPPATRTSVTTKTVADLQAHISEILRRPELEPAIVSLKVVSLDTGHVLAEENANKLLRPASNMKLYTVGAAVDRLSPDFRFTTSAYASQRPDAEGILHGDLTIYGRGDPSIGARFNNGDYFRALDDLASRIAAAGVKRVEGDLVGDESYFNGPQYGSGWEWEDLQWWYGAEVSALTVNDNALDLFVKPGLKIGAPAVVTTGPPDPLLTIINRATTGPKGSRRDLTVHRGLGANVLEIGGSVPLADNGFVGSIGISHPALLFVHLLRSSLAQHGVIVTGRSRTIDAQTNGGMSLDPVQTFSLLNLTNGPQQAPVEIASRQSPPLSTIAAETLKVSQNLYTELILRTLGRLVTPSATSNLGRTSEGAGIEVVKSFLKEAGLTSEGLVLADGSGLSRNDMVTAEGTVRLLTYMSRHRYASVLREALPIAGVDGTLKNRLKGTVAENNLRAKTGTLSSAASLSGYVTTAVGEKLVFSIMVNNFPEDTDVRAILIDPVALLLASFAGRS